MSEHRIGQRVQLKNLSPILAFLNGVSNGMKGTVVSTARIHCPICNVMVQCVELDDRPLPEGQAFTFEYNQLEPIDEDPAKNWEQLQQTLKYTPRAPVSA